MEGFNVYKDIQDRTHGEIYIGVVGAGCARGNPPLSRNLWTRWSFPTFQDGIQRERAIDELPQSSAGRTIMTTEAQVYPGAGGRRAD